MRETIYTYRKICACVCVQWRQIGSTLFISTSVVMFYFCCCWCCYFWLILWGRRRRFFFWFGLPQIVLECGRLRLHTSRCDAINAFAGFSDFFCALIQSFQIRQPKNWTFVDFIIIEENKNIFQNKNRIFYWFFLKLWKKWFAF